VGATLALALVGLSLVVARKPRLPTPQFREATTRWAFGEPLPGAQPFPAELIAALDRSWSERPKDYNARTKHRRADGSPRFTNRLFLAKSPYLRQHAHNPVSWFPWGDEAFELARALKRPVLLSVGYSTCHWCHVMEEESFEDEEIARYLNEHYVFIKVDREERPDVDAVYMSAVQFLTGAGGWPMTVWLTGDRQPYYGGTYFPARDGDRGAKQGFLSLLQQLKAKFDSSANVPEQARQITAAIQSAAAAEPAELPSSDALERAWLSYRERQDREHGGLAGAPKFPSSLPVRLLLRHHHRTGDNEALALASLTLRKMAQGGIYDQVAGGFHRYATDARWLVPHFEKMLYDNSLLVPAYLEGHQATRQEDFARVAREILRYLERDVTSPDGALFSATDADSPALGGGSHEGWFFTWTPGEIDHALGKELGGSARLALGVSERGNFEGRNVLTAAASHPQLVEIRERLYQARRLRPHPLRDEKIIAAWNGLAISALAQASLALADRSYGDRAARAAEFVLTKMRSDGRLSRSFSLGTASAEGYLEDYAFMAQGLVDLFQATGDIRWLAEAIALDEVLAARFADANGGFYRTSAEHEALLVRDKPSYDGAEPSGNSVAALTMLKLYALTGDDRYRRRAWATLRAFGGTLARAPTRMADMLIALDWALEGAKEIAIIVPRSRSEAEPFLDELRGGFLPNRVVVVARQGEDLERQQKLLPWLAHKTAIGDKPTAYVCEQGVCKRPTTDAKTFAEQLVGTHRGKLGKKPAQQ
jgi:uncharacterized protein YyaL (SSP411 family)